MSSATEKERRSRLESTERWNRVTIRLPPDTFERLETLVENDVYPNRSVAIRESLNLPSFNGTEER